MVLALLTSIVGWGCEGRGTSMVAIEPLPDWRSQTEVLRQMKDQQFTRPGLTPLKENDIGAFAGLPYWESDPDYHFVGSISLYQEAQPITIAANHGEPRPGERIGWIDFTLGGQYQQLQVYRLLENEAGDFYLPFKDTTSGDESYATGRYLDLQGPQGGPWVLDFNQAYSPYCAYNDTYSCPLTPRENWLQVPVEAGERLYAKP